jgi:NAD(P)-dependent dehydrogenase (short-subunit alcohol dehydrogenase family)
MELKENKERVPSPLPGVPVARFYHLTTILMSRFKDQTVLVTGAASGIGRATALAFAREEAFVVVSDKDEKEGHETVSSIKSQGGNASFALCDVSRPDQQAVLIHHIIGLRGRLDIAVNNAGIGGSLARTADIPEEEYHELVQINLGGVFFGMQHQIRQMLTQQGGCIVNVASVAGLRALPNSAMYTATKHAVVGLTKTAALEYARKNIRINAICPVFTRSPMVDKLFAQAPDYEQKLVKNIPLGRYGEPQDSAGAILWLCDPGSSFVTGLILPIDGGMMAG